MNSAAIGGKLCDEIGGVRLGVLISAGGRSAMNIHDACMSGELGDARIAIVIAHREEIEGVARCRAAGLRVAVLAQGDAQAVRLRLPDTVRHEIDLLDCVVNVACDIAAQEIRERIDSWFDEGLLNSGLKDQPNVQRLLGRSFDDLAIHASGSGKGYVSDAVKEMAWWTVFAPERIAAPALTHGALPAAELHRQSIQPPAYIPVRVTPKIGRNDTCTCGSGKKYKKCCGA